MKTEYTLDELICEIEERTECCFIGTKNGLDRKYRAHGDDMDLIVLFDDCFRSLIKKFGMENSALLCMMINQSMSKVRDAAVKDVTEKLVRLAEEKPKI